MTTPIDPRRCPLCEQSNGCGMAAGKGTCWCHALKIPAEVLERVPPEARDEACICEKCATGTRRPLKLADGAAQGPRSGTDSPQE